MAEYFLPDVNVLKQQVCDYEVKILTPPEFDEYYTNEWHNALNIMRKDDYKLAVGAYDNGKLIGLAGAVADCDTMWQIGVDVKSEYRKRNIASTITSTLALEILKRDIVPFYCCAWSNIKSVRNAISSGFKPAWVEITAKPIDFINTML